MAGDSDEFKENVLKITKIQLLMFLVLLIIIAIVSFLLIKFFLKPISIIQTALSNVFKFINHETNNADTIKLKTKDEFGAMANAINENIEKTKKNLSDEDMFIKQANKFVDDIKDGNFLAQFDANTNNPALNELKTTFKVL